MATANRRVVRPRILLFLLVLTALTLVTVDERANGGGVTGSIRSTSRDIFAPIGDAADAVVAPIGDFISGIVHYDALKKENARLRGQLDAARNDQLAAKDDQRRYKEALDLLQLPFVGDIPSVAAQVVSVGNSNFEGSVEIDKGTDDGIGKGMPVVASGGLVGRVVQVSKRRSTIQLVTSPDSAVRVRFAGSDVDAPGDQGTAKGNGEGNPLTVANVDVTAKVANGDAVITQRGRFPDNIPVGKVTAVAPGDLEQQVTMVPAVDFGRLDLVKVLLWVEGSAP